MWEPHLQGLHELDDVTHALLNDLRNVTLTVDTSTRIIKEITVNSDSNLMSAAQKGVNMWLQLINGNRVCLISFKRLVMMFSIVVQIKEL